jgi:osmotically-inducible protein OsmY
MPASSSQALRAAIAMAIVLGAVACSTPDTRTEAERTADRALANKVVLALLDGRYLDADHIEVEARRGAVRLSGKVGSDSDLREALRIAAAVPGVQRVIDQIQVIDRMPAARAGAQ